MIGIKVCDTSSPLARLIMVLLIAPIFELSSEFSSFVRNTSLGDLSAWCVRIKNAPLESMWVS